MILQEMLRMVAVLGAASSVSAAMEPQLVEIRGVSSPANFSKLMDFFHRDDDKLERLSNEYARMWVEPEQVDMLTKLGFTVETEGIVDESRINKEISLAKKYKDVPGEEPEWDQYCDFVCMEARLLEMLFKCPDIMQLESIGKTVAGRDIWVVRATSNEDQPEILLAGNIHGDEVTGGQLLQRFMWTMCDTYLQDERMANILGNAQMYFMPMFNPDGYMAGRRGNANNVDLNRDFPNTWTSDYDGPDKRQVETVAMMDFVRDHDFKFSMMYHGGAEVVNYPYDSVRPGTSGYSATTRDEEVTALAKLYADNHRTMSDSRQFPGGIVNGAEWYIIYGSQQDHMYDYRNECIDLTIEVSQSKWPNANQLPRFYDDNLESIFQFCEAAQDY